MKVVGIVNSQGDFNGKPYHNLVFQVTTENENENRDVCGLLVDTVKIRYADLNVVLGLGLADPSDVEKLGAEMFDDYLGAELEVSYNKYGAVQSIKANKAEKPKENKK